VVSAPRRSPITAAETARGPLSPALGRAVGGGAFPAISGPAPSGFGLSWRSVHGFGNPVERAPYGSAGAAEDAWPVRAGELDRRTVLLPRHHGPAGSIPRKAGDMRS